MKILHSNYVISRMSSAWSSGLSTHQAIIQINGEKNCNPIQSEGKNRQFGTILNGFAIDIQPNYSASLDEEISESDIFKLDGSHEINYIEMLESLFPNTKRNEAILDFNQYGMTSDLQKKKTSEEHLIARKGTEPSESVIFKLDGSHEIDYIEMLESLFPKTKRNEPILDFNQYEH